MAEISGYNREAVLNQPLASSTLFFSEQQQNMVSDALKDALKGETASQIQVEMKDSSSSIQRYTWDLSAHRDQSGSIVGVTCMAQLVEESSSSELKQLLDSANTLIFGIDAEGRINEWNQQMAHVTEISRQEAMGQAFETLVLRKFQAPVRQILERALSGQQTTNYELQFRTKVRIRLEFMLRCLFHRTD